MRKVLAIKLDHIGDFALALPALRGLKLAQPDVVIDVAVAPVNLGWRGVVPWLGEFHEVQFPGYQAGRERKTSKIRLLVQLTHMAVRLRRPRYRVAVDLRMAEGDWRGKLLTWLAGAPRRLGSTGVGATFLTEVCVETPPHQTDRIAERLRRFAPDLQPVLAGCVAVQRKLLVPGRREILLHPGAGNAAKRWPLNSWRELCRHLETTNVSFRLLGGRGDEALIREICEGAGLEPGRQVISGGIRESLEVIANADLLVGLDSAAPHLAALVATPAITIFSAANDLVRWRALGDNTVLRTEIACSPCELTACKWTTHRCMEAITPVQVLDAIRAKLEHAPKTQH